MKKAMLGLSGILLASGMALAADYSKLSNDDMIKSLQENNIAKNEEENFKQAREAYRQEKKLFFEEFKKRIDNASKEEKAALEKAFSEYKAKMQQEMQMIKNEAIDKIDKMDKMPHKGKSDKN